MNRGFDFGQAAGSPIGQKNSDRKRALTLCRGTRVAFNLIRDPIAHTAVIKESTAAQGEPALL
jgi:hypothetical protein